MPLRRAQSSAARNHGCGAATIIAPHAVWLNLFVRTYIDEIEGYRFISANCYSETDTNISGHIRSASAVRRAIAAAGDGTLYLYADTDGSIPALTSAQDAN